MHGSVQLLGLRQPPPFVASSTPTPAQLRAPPGDESHPTMEGTWARFWIWVSDSMRVRKKCFQIVSTWFPHPSASQPSLVLQNGYYVITAFTRIRIFEKRLRIRRDTVILMKVGKIFPVWT